MRHSLVYSLPRCPRAVVQQGKGPGVGDVPLGGLVAVGFVAVPQQPRHQLFGQLRHLTGEVVLLGGVGGKVEKLDSLVLGAGQVLVLGTCGPVSIAHTPITVDDLHVTPDKSRVVRTCVVDVKRDLTLGVRLLGADEGAPRVLPIPVRLWGHTSPCGQGRDNIHSMQQPPVHCTPGSGRDQPSHQPCGHTHTTLEQRRLTATKRPVRRGAGGPDVSPVSHTAIVGSHPHKTVLPQALGLQQVRELAHRLVEIVHHRAQSLAVHHRRRKVLRHRSTSLGILRLRRVLDRDVDLLVRVVQKQRLLRSEVVDDALDTLLVVGHRVLTVQLPHCPELSRCVVPEVHSRQRGASLVSNGVVVVVHLPLQISRVALEATPDGRVTPFVVAQVPLTHSVRLVPCTLQYLCHRGGVLREVCGGARYEGVGVLKTGVERVTTGHETGTGG
eukprot:Hpha_TRINITY_DN15882_c1_g3::TRINITY_DN15882_c1_g3_i1::g.189224::m.189224